MVEQMHHLRTIENKDWATALFIFSFVLIAVTKSIFEVRFKEFSWLIVSNKYIKVYRDSNQITSLFTFFLFLVQLISFSFFIHFLLYSFGYIFKTDWLSFIQIITCLTVFILSKYLIEKIIATAFDIEEIFEQLNLQKVNYRTYIGVIILPVNCILYYSNFNSKEFVIGITALVLVFNLITYLVIIKNYQTILLSKLFYFILYLCALEIAPYYFMYYWFTKN